MLGCRLAEELESSGRRQYISHRRVVVDVICNTQYLSDLYGRKRYVVITAVKVYINGSTYCLMLYGYIHDEVDTLLTFNFHCII